LGQDGNDAVMWGQILFVEGAFHFPKRLAAMLAEEIQRAARFCPAARDLPRTIVTLPVGLVREEPFVMR
jgi:hypothetical protein